MRSDPTRCKPQILEPLQRFCFLVGGADGLALLAIAKRQKVEVAADDEIGFFRQALLDERQNDHDFFNVGSPRATGVAARRMTAKTKQRPVRIVESALDQFTTGDPAFVARERLTSNQAVG